MFQPIVVPGGVGQSDVTTSAYSCSAGICKPRTIEATGVFTGLQRQINLLLHRFNQGVQIAMDGVIGKETVKAGGLVLSLLRRQAGGGAEWFAENARRLTEEFAKITRIAPDFRPPVRQEVSTTRTAPPPPAPEDVIVPPPPSPDQVQELAPSPDAPRKGIHWGWWMLGGLLLVGAGYMGYRYFIAKPKSLRGGNDEDFGYGEASDDFIDV